MKRSFVFTLMAVVLPLGAVAQDDMYFVPTKANVEKSARDFGMPRDTYYSGSDRSVDDYNRRSGSMLQPIDSLGNDIIEFDAVAGVYPDSTGAPADYACTRRMSRFDDYDWVDPYWAGYYAGRLGYWSYYPWYDYAWYYDPWYTGPWYSGWYYPWHHGYWGWNGWGWGGSWGSTVIVGGGHRGGPTGTHNRARTRIGGGASASSSSRFGGARSVRSGIANRNRASSYGGTSNRSTSRFGGSRSTSSSSVRSYSPPVRNNSTISSGSFGGSRSGGSFGGSRSGGGSGGSRGGFGGRR